MAEGAELVDEIGALTERLAEARRMVDRVFVGQDAVVEQVLAAIDEPLLYARIDMARDGDAWKLMEAELIEPDFYLGHDPRGGAGFARAVRERLEQA